MGRGNVRALGALLKNFEFSSESYRKLLTSFKSGIDTTSCGFMGTRLEARRLSRRLFENSGERRWWLTKVRGSRFPSRAPVLFPSQYPSRSKFPSFFPTCYCLSVSFNEMPATRSQGLCLPHLPLYPRQCQIQGRGLMNVC